VTTVDAVAPRVELVAVRPGDGPAVDAVVELHATLLPFGPMARLGRHFLREHCYRTLLDAGLYDVVLCRVDGRPAGFTAYTDRGVTFSQRAFRTRFVRAGGVALVSVLREQDWPARVRDAASAVLDRREGVDDRRDPLAEVIALAVHPDFTSPAFVRATRVRVSELLVTHCAAAFRSRDLPDMRMWVDADNRGALLFYQALGARIDPAPVARRPSRLVTFDLRDPAILPADGVPAAANGSGALAGR
jgi:ribosomal protein S18 acetylase RimI-like enzyme